MTKEEKATQFFASGFNCAQSVFMAFCEDFGLTLDQGAKLAFSFGGGMGQMRETCGALTGAFLVLGLAANTEQPPSPEEKSAHYQKVRQLAEAFRFDNGSMICRELLAVAENGNKKKPCGQLVGDTAAKLEKLLEQMA